MISLSTVRSILKEYEFDERSVEEKITPADLETLLTSLYVEASKKIGFIEGASSMAQLYLAFLQNVFAINDEPLLFFQVKVALTLFSSAKLSEKHKYLFYISSSESCMIQRNLHLLLVSLSKLAEVVGEQLTFGTHQVPFAVKNCVKFCKGKITERKFLKWLSLEPQTIVWLTTLHRISVSETISHFVTCDNCHTSPIVGLRYRCLNCISYNMCQNCFFSGLYSKGHKEKHSVHEYCQPASAWEETKSTITAVRNKIPFARCPTKAYLSFDEDSIYDSLRESSTASKCPETSKSYSQKTVSSHLLKELASIIGKLEDENRQIAALMNSNAVHPTDINVASNYNADNFEMQDFSKNKVLQEHKDNLEIQLERLKELFKNLKTCSPANSPKKETGIVSPVPHVPFHKSDHYFESTPITNGTQNIFQQQSHHVLKPQSTYSLHQPTPENTQNNSKTYRTRDSTSLDLTDAFQNSDARSVEELRGQLGAFGDTTSYSMTNLLSQEVTPDCSEPYCSESYGSVATPSTRGAAVANLSSFSQHQLFELNRSKDQSLETMEFELQAMLDQLEKLLPQISSLPNDSQETGKVLSTLSEMEEAVKKLSHLSLETTAGSTNL